MEYKHISDRDLAQIRNIIADDPSIALEVMRDCADIVGLTTKAEYSMVMCVPIRTVQDGCKKGSIVHLDIDGSKFPCVNCNINK